MRTQLNKFNKIISPFSIFDHGNNLYALLLDADNLYGFHRSGYDWERLMQSFIAKELPKAAGLLNYDSEGGMFCAYCNDLDCLMDVAKRFKAMCDNHAGVAPQIYTLPSGLRLVKDINPIWNDYDINIARIHLANCGWIILDDEYAAPIDNEYDLGEIYTMIERLGLSTPKQEALKGIENKIICIR